MRGAFPCVTGASCSPWPPSSAWATFVYAPFSPDWWLPNPPSDSHHVVSTFGREIDSLFVIILVITGIVFIGTQVVLVWVALPVRGREGRRGPARPAGPVLPRQPAARGDLDDHPGGHPGLHRALPDGDLGRASSSAAPRPRCRPLAEITARQFQWVMRYPGPDGKLNTQDDLFTVNDLHFVKNKTALIYLKSSDVLHSFFLPQMRIKQDAVPGLTIPVWFDSDTAGKFELVCAELCGWGHYKMRGKVTVHETEEEFQKWQSEKLAEQNQSQLTMATGIRRGDDRYEFAERYGNGSGGARRPHGHEADHGHGHGDDHIHPAPTALPLQVRLLDRPQGHRHPVPVLGADLLRPRRPAGDGRPLAARLALEADADPEPGCSGPTPRSATRCRRSSTTSCSRCTRRS